MWVRKCHLVCWTFWLRFISDSRHLQSNLFSCGPFLSCVRILLLSDTPQFNLPKVRENYLLSWLFKNTNKFHSLHSKNLFFFLYYAHTNFCDLTVATSVLHYSNMSRIFGTQMTIIFSAVPSPYLLTAHNIFHW